MKKRIGGAVAIGVFFLGVGLWRAFCPASGVGGNASTVVTDAAHETPAKPKRTLLPRPPVAVRKPAESTAPAPSPALKGAALPAAATTPDESPSPAADQQAPLIDRRPASQLGDGSVAAAIQDNMEDVREDIAGCINDWLAVEPNIEGKVNVGFRINADGLQEAWIADHESVPDGPLTCFASAVYAADWEGISDQPVEVTFPFVVTSEEAAATP